VKCLIWHDYSAIVLRLYFAFPRTYCDLTTILLWIYNAPAVLWWPGRSTVAVWSWCNHSPPIHYHALTAILPRIYSDYTAIALRLDHDCAATSLQSNIWMHYNLANIWLYFGDSPVNDREKRANAGDAMNNMYYKVYHGQITTFLGFATILGQKILHFLFFYTSGYLPYFCV